MGQPSETQQIVLILKVIKQILTALNRNWAVFPLVWGRELVKPEVQAKQSVVRTNCVWVLGRKPLHQQHGLIGYQPRAFNKDLLRSQPVDNASRMLKEWGDKEKICFNSAVQWTCVLHRQTPGQMFFCLRNRTSGPHGWGAAVTGIVMKGKQKRNMRCHFATDVARWWGIVFFPQGVRSPCLLWMREGGRI